MATAMRSVLKAVREKLGEAHALTVQWRRAELCSSREWVYAWIGAADPEGVRLAAEEFEASFGRQFPEDLRLIWSELNGIAVHARAGVPDAPACSMVDPRELPDPTIWPCRGRGDPLQIADGDLLSSGNLYLVGEVRGHGYLALAIPDDEEDPSSDLMWVANTLTQKPVRLAPSLRDFIGRWGAAGFLMDEILASAGIKLAKG